jgi:ABC-type lipoprotein release transport system permease subunit
MRAIIFLAIKDLQRRWALALVLAALFGITFASFLTLFSYQRSALNIYAPLGTNWLVVGNSDGLSEIHGSRISATAKELLLQKGYSDPIPEIHQIVGTSLSNGTLMRGFRLEDYKKITPFTLLTGRELRFGDPSRLVMVGETLSRTKQVKVGSDLLLRGRKFRVIGIFKTGSIEDNVAWISLSDAQELLNYGQDVSLYLIPDSGVLQPGDMVAEAVSVTQRGETSGVFGHSILSFFNFMGVVGSLVGIAAAVTMANLLWRLAYLRRHEFGILKSVGFGFRALLLYFVTQSGLILLAGILIGLFCFLTILFAKLQEFSAFGFGISASLGLETIVNLIFLVFGFLGIGVILPLVSVYKTSIPDLLGRN